MIASGDTVWIAPGTYRETFTPIMTSPTTETKIYGDPSASQFSDVAPGPVIWTAYTTNDTTVSAGSPLITLNGKDFLTFQDLVMIGGDTTGGCVSAATVTSTDIVLRRCALISSSVSTGTAVKLTIGANVAANWVIDSCIVWAPSDCVAITLTKPATADFDHNITVKNCLLLSRAVGVSVLTTGANTFKPGGVRVVGCTMNVGTGMFINSAVTSTTIPCTCVGCLITGQTGFNSSAAGQLTEDYNIVACSTLRTNVTAGTHSKDGTAYAVLPDLGQSWLQGFLPRPYMTPMAASRALGFGDDGTVPATDIMGRPRPAGGNSTSKAVGCFERHDTARVGLSLGADAGGYVELVGPGDQDIRIPVDAAATVISVKVRWDATHADTNKPQAILLANAAIGVATETKTATGTAGSAYETLTFASQTPTAKGVVVVRLVSRSAAANGIAAFDTIAVS